MNKPSITKITVGRLYNLGNYEHVRYEITAEVPENCSARQAVVGIEKILSGLKPVSCKSLGDLRRAAEYIQEMKAQSDEDFKSRHFSAVGTREEITARYEKQYAVEVETRRLSLENAAKARDLFDCLGGASIWKDAKLDWDQEDC